MRIMICTEKNIECMYFGHCIHCEENVQQTCLGKQGLHKQCFVCFPEKVAGIGQIPCRTGEPKVDLMEEKNDYKNDL